MVVRNNISEYKENLKDIAGVICRNIIALNPAKSVVYRPYFNEKFVKRELGAFVKINLNEFFGNVKKGDYCYVEANLLCQCDTMVLLTVKGGRLSCTPSDRRVGNLCCGYGILLWCWWSGLSPCRWRYYGYKQNIYCTYRWKFLVFRQLCYTWWW